MDRRSHAIGIGVGRFLSNKGIDKKAVVEFLKELYAKGDYQEYPFAEECGRIEVLFDQRQTLCTVLGIK